MKPITHTINFTYKDYLISIEAEYEKGYKGSLEEPAEEAGWYIYEAWANDLEVDDYELVEILDLLSVEAVHDYVQDLFDSNEEAFNWKQYQLYNKKPY
jgi:hypothetical protein